MGIGKLKTVGDMIRIDYGCRRKEKEWRTRFCGGDENEGKKLKCPISFFLERASNI